jgi:hypothetical protein
LAEIPKVENQIRRRLAISETLQESAGVQALACCAKFDNDLQLTVTPQRRFGGTLFSNRSRFQFTSKAS